MTNNLHIIERPDSGYEVHISLVSSGYSVAIFDVDSNEFFPTVRIFPTEAAALLFAETL
jgi:hypothetical protein